MNSQIITHRKWNLGSLILMPRHTHTHTHISLCISFSYSNTSAWIHTYTEVHRMRTVDGSGLVCHFGVPLKNDKLIIRGEHTHRLSVGLLSCLSSHPVSGDWWVQNKAITGTLTSHGWLCIYCLFMYLFILVSFFVWILALDNRCRCIQDCQGFAMLKTDKIWEINFECKT